MHPQCSTPLPDTTLAYLAGFLDGEGWIGVRARSGRGGCTSHKLLVAISNTNHDILLLFQTNFGGSVCVQRPSRLTRRTCHQWTTGSTKGMRFLAAVLPYLRVKRQQAELAIAFQQRMLTTCHRGKRSPEEFAARDVYRQKIQDLNGWAANKARPDDWLHT